MTHQGEFHLMFFNRIPVVFKALIFALIVHAVMFLSWQSSQPTAAVKLPQWLHVKLQANTVNEKNTVIEKTKFTPQDKPIIKKNAKPNKVSKKKVKSNTEKSKAIRKVKAVTEKETVAVFTKANHLPYLQKNPRPVYPLFAKKRGMQGTVMLKVYIEKNGIVSDVKLVKSSGYKILDNSALNSVSQWQFEPAKKGNQSVASLLQVPVRFVLKER